MTDDDDEEFCAKCGDSEFDEDGKETHDYEPYDHDFVYEKDEEEKSITLKDVKDLADTVKSIAEAGKVLKNIPQIPPRPTIWEEAGRDTHSDKKQEKRHRETIKWTKIGIVVGSAIALILGILSLINWDIPS